MKKLLLLAVSGILLVGCGGHKQVSPQEAWQGFCKSIPSAAYNIMTDRQQGITESAALENAKKIQDEHARNYLVSLVEEAYKVPLYEQMADKEKAMADFGKGRYDSCVAQQP
ncbi:hypothetical protein [Acinetobacter nectaris]|uniref:hypothetical protein n=1 Tax=Acinetobacter nectaris TaxID=1219382 RepID=UPI001F32FD34|nr:hypothetical protein [Acinetobacter nectaris]MCF9045946.1 hypothetical protein [Acinetobacter nectaris]